MRVGNEKPPFGGKLVLLNLKISRSEVGHCNGFLDMKFAFTPVIEQTECRVAPLLEFCNNETGANCVNRPGGHQNRVVCRHRAPSNEIGDRPIVDGRAQLLGSQTPIKAKCNLGIRNGT